MKKIVLKNLLGIVVMLENHPVMSLSQEEMDSELIKDKTLVKECIKDLKSLIVKMKKLYGYS